MSDRHRFPWSLYLAAALVGGLAGLIGAAFHAVLDGADQGRDALRAALDAAPIPGWLVLMVLGALVLVTALWMVRRFAPETAGSGIQEVEAILAGQRTLRWRRVLPVKFVAGFLAVGSGLVLGREGPTVHMGAALGQMASERMAPDDRQRRALIAAGAAAGLAAAFNAPLAAIVFVTEELREHFEYSFASIQSVILACCAAVVVSGWILGQGPDLPVPNLDMAPLAALPLFVLLGLLIGALGVVFNGLLLGSARSFRALSTEQAYLSAAVVGMVLGALLWLAPDTVGGGEALVESLPREHPELLILIALIAVRLLTTVGSYGIGLPGGIFAPLLALGTIAGAAFSELVATLAPSLSLEPGIFAVAAMGALFAATVRAPLTGIILVIELTGAQVLALPIILTCLTATFTAEAMGGRPIYSLLLGLSDRPAPPRSPVRRILAAGMILAAMVAVDRFHAVQPDEASLPIQASTDVSASVQEEQVGSGAMSPPASSTDADNPGRNLRDGESETGESSSPQPTKHAVASATPPVPPPAVIPAARPVIPSESIDTVAPAEHDSPASAESPIQTESRPEPIARKPHYSIQLISFRRASSLAPFARRQGLLEQARTLDAGASGWHPLLIGEFESRDAAEAARDSLPADLRGLKPIIRTIAPSERLRPVRSPN
ncbi:H(+)/Cl(-) exchange transporter ClcA (modular protein) [Thiocapsa sp. KS1]|nr:H(+)/Cl(-) exchange transporter ClcA (modular protein) [Thiocapsa sp. KS1]